MEALADDDINNAYEIIETADGRYAYLLSVKESEAILAGIGEGN